MGDGCVWWVVMVCGGGFMVCGVLGLGGFYGGDLWWGFMVGIYGGNRKVFYFWLLWKRVHVEKNSPFI